MNTPALLEMLSYIALVGAIYFTALSALKLLASLHRWGLTVPLREPALAAICWIAYVYLPILAQ